jgi:hypothetical protein
MIQGRVRRHESVGVVPNSLQDIGRASDGAKRRPVEAEGIADRKALLGITPYPILHNRMVWLNG